MKLYAFLLALTLFLLSCDGADNGLLSDDHCFFALSMEGLTNTEHCKVNFIFKDENGENYEWSVRPNSENFALISLPKNLCYDAWVTSVGCDTEDITWGIPGEGEDQKCFDFERGVEGRLEIYAEHLPHFSFCLDDVCSCPEVTEHD